MVAQKSLQLMEIIFDIFIFIFSIFFISISGSLTQSERQSWDGQMITKYSLKYHNKYKMQPYEMFDLQRRSMRGLYKMVYGGPTRWCSGIVSGSLCQASKNAGGDIQRAPLNQKSREFFTLPEHDSCWEHVRVVKRRGRGGRICLFTCRAQERAANGQSMGTQQLPTRLDSTRRAHWVD